MPAIEPLCNLLGMNCVKLTKEENLILEAELFKRICDVLNDLFRAAYLDYMRITKLISAKESAVIEPIFIREVINDILLSKEYSLEGLAYYTDTPEEVLCDILTGKNNSPTFNLSRKIIDLHRGVRPLLYREIVNKITADMLQEQMSA